jgi:hypothetical protein
MERPATMILPVMTPKPPKFVDQKKMNIARSEFGVQPKTGCLDSKSECSSELRKSLILPTGEEVCDGSVI